MHLPKNRPFLLFDMDGTLVDTEPVGPQNFVNQLKKYDEMPTAEERELFIRIWRRDGTTIKQDDWLPKIARKYGIPRSDEAYLKEFYEMYAEAIEKAPSLPGADAFLRRAHAAGAHKLALVTASKRRQVKIILKYHGWQYLFDAVVASEDFTRHKPDPEPYRAALQKLGAESSRAIVFEDSKNGVNAAAAAGCYVVGLRAGNAAEQDLSRANTVIETFNDVTLP